MAILERSISAPATIVTLATTRPNLARSTPFPSAEPRSLTTVTADPLRVSLQTLTWLCLC